MPRFAVLFALPLLCLAAWASAESPAPVKVALQKRDTGTFYLNGAIEGYGELEMLVDTGSSYLVIGEPVLKQLKVAGRAQFSRRLKGTMADGRPQTVPLYRISSLRLGESCWVRDIEAAVIPGQTRAIVGMNVLSRLAPFTFSAEPADLLLHQCQNQPGAVVAAEKSLREP